MDGDLVNCIFMLFSQVEFELVCKNGGIGFGLVIVKKFVELMGGDIFVESVLGVGLVFLVELLEVVWLEVFGIVVE